VKLDIVLVLVAVGSATSLGCGVDLGTGAGAMLKTGNGVVYGRVAGSTKPLVLPVNDRGVLFGLSLEGRAEEKVGSRFDGGVLVGFGSRPYWMWDVFGVEAYGEFGTPLRAALFSRGDHYFAAAVAAPIPLDAKRAIADMNKSTWILKRQFELVPLFRIVDHRDHDAHATFVKGLELSGGLSVRYRVVSDLF